MEAHPEMVRVPARGRDTQRASVIWRRDGKVRVELWTSPGWNRHSAPSGRCVTLPESKVTPAPGDRPSILGAAFAPVTIGTSSQGVEWVAYYPEDVAPMTEAFEAMEAATLEAEMLDFSVETMGYCHGVNLRPMFSKVWP